MSIEPLYSLAVACELIPCSEKALTYILSSRKEQFNEPHFLTEYAARERHGKIVDYKGGLPLRMLLESEVLRVREILVQPRQGRRTRPAYDKGPPRKRIDYSNVF